MNDIIQFIIDNIEMLYILVLATYLGMEIIANVPTVLHTPLMSGANAVSGVVVIGAIILIRQAPSDNYILLSIGMLGIALANVNVIGGFVVTDRMLHMFKKKKK